MGVITKLLIGFWQLGDEPLLICFDSLLTFPLSKNQINKQNHCDTFFVLFINCVWKYLSFILLSLRQHVP